MNLIITIHGILGGKSGKNGAGGLYQSRDLYKHLYDNIISPNKSLYNKINIVIHSWSKEYEQDIISHFNPDSYIIESPLYSKRHISKLYSMFKSVSLCNKLDINSSDVIFHTRFDNYYKKPLIINPKDIEQNNTIYFPGDDLGWNNNDKQTRVCDNYFISNAKHLINYLTNNLFETYSNWIDEGTNINVRAGGTGRIDNHTIIRNIFKDKWTIVKSDEYISKRDITIHRMK